MNVKKQNKLILILLVTFIIGLLIPSYSNAMSNIVTGTCGENITWTLNEDTGLLKISGSGSMNTTTCQWEDYKDKVKTVEFDGKITSISQKAFYSNTNIKEIDLPDTITTIGSYAFAECKNLKTVDFPDSSLGINSYAFYNCTSLEEVDLYESFVSIKKGAFSGCTSLKKITIEEIYVGITEDESTFPENATLCGYKASNIFYYARKYGRAFLDLSTNNISTKTVTNIDYLNVLPTTNLKALGPTSHGQRSTGGESVEYICNFAYESDKTNSKYKEIKAKVDEITKECSTDADKALAIFKWIRNNMTYKYGWGAQAKMDRIYEIYEQKTGNCESYTMLTNYMFTLAGIPTGTVSNLVHEWTVAYVDGEWTYYDSTNGIYGLYYSAQTANQISFAYNGHIYVIDDVDAEMKESGTIEIKDEITSEDIAELIFNYQYYADKYPDLKSAFGYNETKLKNHWLTYGIKEGRVASRLFDAKYYIYNNTDIKKAYGLDYQKAYNHFITFGWKELRPSSSEYYGKYYKNAYSDFADFSAYQLMKHYVENGVKEGRKATNVIDMTPVDITTYMFDSTIYANVNQDVKRVYGTDSSKLKGHWNNYGMKEGRVASLIFDAKYYLNKYSDLKKAFGTDYKKAYNHFVTTGIYEGRQGSKYFDVKYYLNNNSDLKKAFGTNYTKALNHFMKIGINEGRTASAEFSVKKYKSYYSDLKNAFGDNYYKYFMHYLTNGIKEGRKTV